MRYKVISINLTESFLENNFSNEDWMALGYPQISKQHIGEFLSRYSRYIINQYTEPEQRKIAFSEIKKIMYEKHCSLNIPKMNADYLSVERLLLDRARGIVTRSEKREISLFLAGTLSGEVKLAQAMIFNVLYPVYQEEQFEKNLKVEFYEWVKDWNIKIVGVSINIHNLEDARASLFKKLEYSQERPFPLGSDYFANIYEGMRQVFSPKIYNSWVELGFADLLADSLAEMFKDELFDAVFCVSSLYEKTPLFADKVAAFLKPNGLFLRHRTEPSLFNQEEETLIYHGLQEILPGTCVYRRKEN